MSRCAYPMTVLLAVTLMLVACTSVQPAPAPSMAPTVEPTKAAPSGIQTQELSTYRALIEAKIETVEPQPALAAWSTMELVQRVIPAPQSYSLTIADMMGSEEDKLKFLVVGSDAYYYSQDDGGWIRLSGDVELRAQLGRMLLDPISVAESAPAEIFAADNIVGRDEEVDGVKTTHYRAPGPVFAAMLQKAGSTDMDGFISGQADFWLANEGSYLKRYTYETVVRQQDERQLRTSASILITDENQPVSISAPGPEEMVDSSGVGSETPEPSPAGPGVPQAKGVLLSELPAPPQGAETTLEQVPEGIRETAAITAGQFATRIFLSDAAPDAIHAFYDEVLPRFGYELVVDQPGDALVSIYMLDSESIMVMIQRDPSTGKTVVLLQSTLG